MTRDEIAVLAANDAFYEAFNAGDAEAMAVVWARAAPVACVHPGRHVLHGHRDVMQSWERILEGPDSPSIACMAARAFIAGDSAFVVCTERLREGDLVATNIFVREGSDWKLVHHQAGPAPPVAEEPADPTLH